VQGDYLRYDNKEAIGAAFVIDDSQALGCGLLQKSAWALVMTKPIAAAEAPRRSYSGGLSSPPMNTCSRRNRMPLVIGSSAAKWISRGRAAATTRSTLRAVTPPPGTTTM
jgi:hypothetical protein